MSRLLVGSLAFVVAMTAGHAKAADWTCGSTARFGDSSLGVYVQADDNGQLREKNGAATVEYVPGPERGHLDLTLGYSADVDAKEMVPTRIFATAPIERYDSGGRLVLQLGQTEFSWPISPTFFMGSNSADMWVDRKPDRALSDALMAGGPGRLSVESANGKVRGNRDLNILGTMQLMAIVAKAYPVAIQFAATPTKSSFCTRSEGRLDAYSGIQVR